MKKQTVQTKVSQLIRHYGGGGRDCHARARGRTALGKVLAIAPSYIFKMGKGQRKPGIHLWQAIERLYDEVLGKKDKKNETL